MSSPSQEAGDSIVTEGDKLTATVASTKSPLSFDQFVKRLKINITDWECTKFEAKRHQMAAMPKAVGSSSEGWERQSTSPIIVDLWSHWGTFRRRTEVISARSEIDSLVKDAISHIPVYKPRPVSLSDHNMLEIAIADHHFGKRAWAEECGENYDLKIAQKIWTDAVDYLISDNSHRSFEKVLFVLGNDLINADNLDDTTTGGTPQTTDNRQQKTFRETRKIVVETIDKLLDIAPVDVIVVPGNHDRYTAFTLGDAVECWYHNNPNVSVNNHAVLRKYYAYGANLICFTHGSEEKLSDLPNIMAAECPELWGSTLFRECHIGHFHKSSLMSKFKDEVNGARVRVLSTLCASEDWHTQKGYTKNVRSSEAFVWNAQRGMVSTSIYNVLPGVSK